MPEMVASGVWAAAGGRCGAPETGSRSTHMRRDINGLLDTRRKCADDMPYLSNEPGQGDQGRSRSESPSFLVITEIAMAVVLCVGAGLLVRSFIGLVNVD